MRQKIDRADPLHRVRQLQNSRRARDHSNHYWIEGIRQFIRAFEAGLEFQSVIVSPILLKSHLIEEMLRQLAIRGVHLSRISPEQFRSVSIAERASGIGAVMKQHWRSLENCAANDGLCWLVIEDL